MQTKIYSLKDIYMKNHYTIAHLIYDHCTECIFRFISRWIWAIDTRTKATAKAAAAAAELIYDLWAHSLSIYYTLFSPWAKRFSNEQQQRKKEQKQQLTQKLCSMADDGCGTPGGNTI